MATDDDRASTPEHTPDALPSRTDSEAPARDDATAGALPDDIDPQPYLEIRPADASLGQATLASTMRRLAAALRDHESSGVLARLTRSVTVPRVEMLLVADGNADASLRYLVGTYPVDDELRQTVRSVLRGLLPPGAELRETQFHPLAVRSDCDDGRASRRQDRPAPARDRTATSTVSERGSPDRALSPSSRGTDTPGHDTTATSTAGTSAETARETVGTGSSRRAATGQTTARDRTARATPYVAGVEWRGVTPHRRDWLTPLATPADRPDAGRVTEPQVPVASIADVLAEAAVPAVYQVLIRASPDWTDEADLYAQELRDGTASLVDQFLAGVLDPDGERDENVEPSIADQRRIDDLRERTLRTPVTVSARAVALTRTVPGRADAVARQLSTALTPLSGPSHEVRGTVRTDGDRGRVGAALAHLPGRTSRPPGTQIYADLVGAVAYPAEYSTLWAHLPTTSASSRGIVAAPAELPRFWLTGGGDLSAASQRALATQRPARTGLALPPPGQLARYRGAGWPLGRPLDADRRGDGEPVVLPPSLQPLHMLVVGATGAGKSTALTTGMLANHDATDGPAILFDAKGGGMARDYLRAHYAKYGDLEDVVYVDCTRTLPAVGVLDIRPLLDVGVSREEARSRIAGHYEEILSGVMGAERYASAVRSPDVITNHLKALFDPVHGDDAVAHRDLVDALQHTQRDGEPPAVTDESLDDHFQSLLDSEPRVFSQVLGGALSRVETIATDGRLAPLFDHVPERNESETDTADGATTADDGRETLFDAGPERDGTDDQGSGHETVGYTNTDHTKAAPRLSFTDLLNDDRVVVVDFGSMEDAVKDTLTLVLLSQLWTALKARQERAEGGEDGADALVNLYLEDAGSVAGTELVDTLLSQGRSFGLSVTLGVQYPGQLETSDPGRDTYREVLNETATMLVGNVSVDDDLARALATTDLPPDRLAQRLGSLERGEWLCRPASGFGEAPPAPFLVASLDPPAGHPASDAPVAERAFQRALADCRARTTERHGISLREVSAVDGDSDGSEATDDTAAEEDEPEGPLPRHTHLRTTLVHTGCLPSGVSYSEPADALHCVGCSTRYDPTDAGMARAIECCRGFDNVDRAAVPVVQANLKLTPEAVAESEWSLQQLLFLQVVHNAQQGRYDAPGYDIVHDSMVRLREYAGVGTDDVVELKDAGVLVEDGDHPHRLYSVTSDGRDVIREGRREGLDYGDGKGDLDETSQHRMAVEVGRRYIERRHAENSTSPVQRAKPYHEITVDGETRRLDCAGLDEDGEVVVALEAERINNDVAEAVPADFDKMAACDPDEAIWVVLSRSDGARVVEALADPPDGEPRVATTYNERTATYKYQIDTPGLTDVFTVTYVRDTLLGES